MKAGSRALRRHHLSRVKNRWRAVIASQTAGRDQRDAARVVGIRATTATPCSCSMCGNPRKFYREETLQERRWRNQPD